MAKPDYARVDEVLKRLLKTPPKPHAPLKAKRKRKASPKKRGAETGNG